MYQITQTQTSEYVVTEVVLLLLTSYIIIFLYFYKIYKLCKHSFILIIWHENNHAFSPKSRLVQISKQRELIRLKDTLAAWVSNPQELPWIMEFSQNWFQGPCDFPCPWRRRKKVRMSRWKNTGRIWVTRIPSLAMVTQVANNRVMQGKLSLLPPISKSRAWAVRSLHVPTITIGTCPQNLLQLPLLFCSQRASWLVLLHHCPHPLDCNTVESEQPKPVHAQDDRFINKFSPKTLYF